MTLFLIITAAVVIWLVSLVVHPFGACPRCHGNRIVMHGGKRRPRPVKCPKCKGRGRRQRPVSRAVHQLIRRVERHLARQAAERARAATTRPEE